MVFSENTQWSAVFDANHIPYIENRCEECWVFWPHVKGIHISEPAAQIYLGLMSKGSAPVLSPAFSYSWFSMPT